MRSQNTRFEIPQIRFILEFYVYIAALFGSIHEFQTNRRFECFSLHNLLMYYPKHSGGFKEKQTILSYDVFTFTLCENY